ncbi:MAG: hypothetical protein VYE77_00930 [Planctomycetota bacterium]|nr:hypothetical protein [Planctomycetota bacterium]
MGEASTCPICLEDGAKLVLCRVCKTHRYHPACVAALEESGATSCPTCRRALETGPRKGGPPSTQPVDALGGALTMVALLVCYIALGMLGGYGGYVYDVETQFAWICPEGLTLANATGPVVIPRQRHPEVSDESWGGVVRWAKESPKLAPVVVVTATGTCLSARWELLNQHAEDHRRDLRLHPVTCHGDGEQCRGPLTVDFLHANYMRYVLDPTSSGFAVQAVVAAAGLLTTLAVAWVLARACQD